jgi:hypothetical protein
MIQMSFSDEPEIREPDIEEPEPHPRFSSSTCVSQMEPKPSTWDSDGALVAPTSVRGSGHTAARQRTLVSAQHHGGDR